MTRIEYLSIDLAAPSRVFLGKAKVTDVAAVNGVTITRIIDGPLDYFEVRGQYVVPGYEVEGRNVVGGVRAARPTIKTTGGHAKKDPKDAAAE